MVIRGGYGSRDYVPLKDLHGIARGSRKRHLEWLVERARYPSDPTGEKKRREALQELHDAGELPLCSTCAREIGWDGLSLGGHTSSGGPVCGDCRNDERERSMRRE